MELWIEKKSLPLLLLHLAGKFIYSVNTICKNLQWHDIGHQENFEEIYRIMEHTCMKDFSAHFFWSEQISGISIYNVLYDLLNSHCDSHVLLLVMILENILEETQEWERQILNRFVNGVKNISRDTDDFTEKRSSVSLQAASNKTWWVSLTLITGKNSICNCCQ